MTPVPTANAELREEVLAFIDQYMHPLTFYEIINIKTEAAIDLIIRIMEESGKSVEEGVLVFRTVVRQLHNDEGPLSKFIETNGDLICRKANEKKAQSNLPGRALPLFDIFSRVFPDTPVSVIELGASYGLIGRCLRNPQKALEKKDVYFYPDQQAPEAPRPVRRYLGIELAPPTREWLLAWEWDPVRRERLTRFLDDVPADENCRVIKGSAFGFSKLKEVQNLVTDASAVAVLTSFMLYQFDEDNRRKLINQVKEFTHDVKGIWINQTFLPGTMECFIEVDGRKTLDLVNDSCKGWHEI
ncbi:MAG: DUF2332 family protein [bacterium]|nr:DUF2332 family protein [bacterium]